MTSSSQMLPTASQYLKGVGALTATFTGVGVAFGAASYLAMQYYDLSGNPLSHAFMIGAAGSMAAGGELFFENYLQHGLKEDDDYYMRPSDYERKVAASSAMMKACGSAILLSVALHGVGAYLSHNEPSPAQPGTAVGAQRAP